MNACREEGGLQSEVAGPGYQPHLSAPRQSPGRRQFPGGGGPLPFSFGTPCHLVHGRAGVFLVLHLLADVAGRADAEVDLAGGRRSEVAVAVLRVAGQRIRQKLHGRLGVPALPLCGKGVDVREVPQLGQFGHVQVAVVPGHAIAGVEPRHEGDELVRKPIVVLVQQRKHLCRRWGRTGFHASCRRVHGP